MGFLLRLLARGLVQVMHQQGQQILCASQPVRCSILDASGSTLWSGGLEGEMTLPRFGPWPTDRARRVLGCLRSPQIYPAVTS